MTNKKHFPVIALLLTAIAVLSACGNGDMDSENEGVSNRLVSVTLAEAKT